MTQLVIPAAGALLGSYFGPTGASIGWAIGSALTAQDENIDVSNTQQIGDLRVQTSEYGITVPSIIGKQRVVGNVIWAEEKKVHTHTSESSQGGKGGSSTTTTTSTVLTYSTSLAILLCKGEILGIDKIWADGKLIIDSSATAKPLIGTVYPGSNTQTPDPFIESRVGAGNAPAYRGMAYIVLKDFDLGITGRIPNFSFRVLKEGLL